MVTGEWGVGTGDGEGGGIYSSVYQCVMRSWRVAMGSGDGGGSEEWGG